MAARRTRRATSRQNGGSSLAPVAGLLLVALVCCLGVFFVLPRLTPVDAGGLVLGVFDQPAGASDEAVRFTVREGDSAALIGERLQVAGLVGNADAFRLIASYHGLSDRLQAGEYELRPSMRPSEIARAMSRGEGPGRLVTIPEGRRLEEVAALLEGNQIVAAADFLSAAATMEFGFAFLGERPAGASLEGYLFPESYRFGSRVTAQDVLRQMLATFEERAHREIRQGNPRGLSTHAVVTLASIVEREAVVPAERPTIASVYLNRLQQGIKLDADPTVQFALAADPEQVARHGWWKQRLLFADLEVDSPYNTYLYPGLPPGPIASPGLASIRAVLQPARTDFLFFVARPDGSHLFARTLEEHNANVRRVQSQ